MTRPVLQVLDPQQGQERSSLSVRFLRYFPPFFVTARWEFSAAAAGEAEKGIAAVSRGQ